MASTIKFCKSCRAELRVPLAAQGGIECPVCGNINSYGGPPVTRQYSNYYGNGYPVGNMNGGQNNGSGYQYQDPFLATPRQQAPANRHAYYQQSRPLRASTNFHGEQPPLPRQGSLHHVRNNRYDHQPPPSPPQESVQPMHGVIYYRAQPPRRPSYPVYRNEYYQPHSPAHPHPARNNNTSRPSVLISASQGSPRPLHLNGPYHNGYYQKPFQVSRQQSLVLPRDDEDDYYQHQTSPHPANHNGYYEPRDDEDDYYQHQTSPRPANHNGYYEQPSLSRDPRAQMQISPPHVFQPQVSSNGYNRQLSLPESPPAVQSSLNRPPYGNNQLPSQSAHQDASSPPRASPNRYTQQPSHLLGATASPRIQMSPQVSHTPSAYGRKRAVVCGVSYHGQKNSLDASTNDARSMKDFLVHNKRFPDASIFLLTEDEMDSSRIPTRSNMQKALKWLVEGCQAGDSLVFYYTGHGSKERDFDGDEIDGYDELLCPVDYQNAGKLTDDEINATIVHPLPPGAKLHAIVDTCHSGTILDLPFIYKMDSEGENGIWEDQRIQYAEYKGTSGGIAISISACADHQKSANTTAFTGKSTGALTYSLIQILSKEPNITYGHLLNSMRNSISEVQQKLDQPPQEPQLSSSEKFRIHSKPLIL